MRPSRSGDAADACSRTQQAWDRLDREGGHRRDCRARLGQHWRRWRCEEVGVQQAGRTAKREGRDAGAQARRRSRRSCRWRTGGGLRKLDAAILRRVRMHEPCGGQGGVGPAALGAAWPPKATWDAEAGADVVEVDVLEEEDRGRSRAGPAADAELAARWPCAADADEFDVAVDRRSAPRRCSSSQVSRKRRRRAAEGEELLLGLRLLGTGAGSSIMVRLTSCLRRHQAPAVSETARMVRARAATAGSRPGTALPVILGHVEAALGDTASRAPMAAASGVLPRPPRLGDAGDARVREEFERRVEHRWPA